MYKRFIKGTIVVSICIILLAVNVYGDSILKLGSTGSEVVVVQNKLKSLSYANFNATGYYGVLTRDAVKRYQKDNGLVSDGIVGNLTRTKLGITQVLNNLRFGSRGSEVIRLQNLLNSRGFPAGKIDGIYGSMTRNAVINFQKANGLVPDGIAGPKTLSKLDEVTSRGNTAAVTSSDDLYWMSRIISAEAGAEPYLGKVAVGNVIMNRVVSSIFPNSVKGVIFEYYEGIPQFSPVADGTIYNNPDEESIKAAKEALTGSKPVGLCTYFFNPDKSTGYWIVSNKTYVMRIGNHTFYK